MAKRAKKDKFKLSGKLGALSDKLYSNAEKFDQPVLEKLEGVEPTRPAESVENPIFPETPGDWENIKIKTGTGVDGAEETRSFFKINESSMKLLKYFLGISLLFFVGAVFVASVVFLRGGNQISTENVLIDVAGPISVGAGEVLSYDISFSNENNTDLEGANILIEYPRGTRNPDGSGELLRESTFLGDIPAGGIVNLHRQAILFGETDEKRTIIVSIEYRVKDSSATYFKEKSYEILIATSPVSLVISSFEEIIADQEFEFTVEVVSNSPTVIDGMILRVDYPYGFSFSSASPSPAFENNVFSIGDLRPSEKRVYKIRGKLSGRESEERNFAFNLGTKDLNNEKLLETIFVISNRTVAIKRPFMSVDLLLDGVRDENFSTGASKRVSGSIVWTNNLPNRITDLEIAAKISGQFERTNVSAGQGFYRSIDDTVVWNKATTNSLAVVGPSESGSVNFSISTLPTSALVYNPGGGHTVKIEISVKARRLSDANVPEEITSSVTRIVKFESELGLRGRSLYFTGPFTNQGPIPPTAERNTTYTIIWSLTNTINNVSGATVRARLPTYATFVGSVSPASELVVYNQQSGEVVWNVGDLKAGSGISELVREVAFQVSIVPSLSQLGATPTIIGPYSVTGIDRFTQNTIKASAREINTEIEDAFMYTGEATRVVAP